jgi:prophage antirepressor-like protein
MNLVPFNFNGAEIRVITDDHGEPWFVAKDIAEDLGYVWAGTSTIAHIPEQWRGVRSVLTPSGMQKMAALTEQGLYFFLGRSDKPGALPMQMWVAGDVLPSIRKTGSYQRHKPPAELSRLELLEIALASEREKIRVTAERDEAVRTKAEIGTRREATAMATASAAVRQVRTLQAELGRGCLQATVTAVEKAAKRKFGKQGFRPLKNWCASRGVAAPKVLDSRYGWVRAWPAAAWAAVYQIDLAALFGADGELE